MSERKAGWYWVKDLEGWKCAEWRDWSWHVGWAIYSTSDYPFEEIGPRIPTPDERSVLREALDDIMNGWMQAIDEALVTTHLGTAEASDSYDTAKRKLGELIEWHVAVALDEGVNGGYRLVPVEAAPKP